MVKKIAQEEERILVARRVAETALSLTGLSEERKEIFLRVFHVDCDLKNIGVDSEEEIARRDYRFIYRIAYARDVNTHITVNVFVSLEAKTNQLSWVPRSVQAWTCSWVRDFKIHMPENALDLWNPQWSLEPLPAIDM